MPLDDPAAGGAIDRPIGAIVVAAGESRRMLGIDKVFAPLLGIPLIAHTVSVFQQSPFIDDIVLVLSKDGLERGKTLAKDMGWHKVVDVCAGGERRQDSVRQGLAKLPQCSWVIVHDGARPCVEPSLLEDGLKAALETGVAVAAVPMKDTVKTVSEHGLVVKTPAREALWAVQTPQVFRWEILRIAHSEVRDSATDDAALVERLGYAVRIYRGSYANIKVTTPDDLVIAEALLNARKVQERK